MMGQANNSENDPNDREYIGERVYIYRRGRRWHAGYQLDGKQHRRSLKTASKKEARRLAIQLEAKILDGSLPKASRAPSIQTAIDAYLAHLRAEHKAAKTIGKAERTYERLVQLAAERKARTLLDVNLSLLDAYRSRRATKARKTVHNETVLIRQLVNFGLSRGMIHTDPLRGLKLRRPKPTRQPYWTKARMDQIVAAARGAHRPVLALLAETGARIAEIQWLTWDDIDFERGLIHIRPKDSWQPKTGDQRAIPMSPAARAVLEQLPRRCRWVMTAAPSRAYPAGDHQIAESRCLAHLKRVLKWLGLPQAGKLHSFRHSFISHALTSGIPEAIVRSWVGQVDEEVLKIYTHIADESSRAAMQRLSASNPNLQATETEEGNGSTGSVSAQFQHKRQEDQNGQITK